MTFQELLSRLRSSDWRPPKVLFVIDPGETTGIAVFVQGELEDCAQVPFDEYGSLGSIVVEMKSAKPEVVLCEEYRVYAGKAAQHSWSKVLTIRAIGTIEYACHMEGYVMFKQLAATAKGFVTDKRLKEWGYYIKGMPHARDAIRHGCYFLLFNKEWKGAI